MELGKKIRQLRVKAGLTQELLAYLYWHRSNAEARKASRYAKEAIRRAPNEKGCQWILSKADPPAGESMTKPKNRRDHSGHACFCNQKGLINTG